VPRILDTSAGVSCFFCSLELFPKGRDEELTLLSSGDGEPDEHDQCMEELRYDL
jgi:hypothetical protein